MVRASLLELLHPDGQAGRVQVIGGNSSADSLVCPEPARLSTSPADLVILAPTAEECARPGWIAHAATEAAQCLAPDGVLYLLADPHCRFAATRSLQKCSLSVEQRFHHHPDLMDGRTLIPMQSRTMAHAYTHLIRTDARRRRLALQVLALPGVLPALAVVLPAVGLALRRHGSRPLFHWLSPGSMNDTQPGTAVVQASWRGADGAVIIHAFDGRETLPTRIAKTWLLAGSANGHEREIANLLRIAPEAGRAGVDVPRVLGEVQLRERPVLIESALGGGSAAARLASHPERLPDILYTLAAWLERWNRATATHRLLTHDLLVDALLRPAAELNAKLDADRGYIGWLEAVCEAVEGQSVPLVAAHNDLTMVNVLLTNDDGATQPLRLGVIDWEDACESSLPLRDFFYSVVDAVAAMRDYVDRSAAFVACFTVGGAWAELIASLQARLCRSLDISEEIVTLSFHACWLHYARKALDRPTGKEAQHFLKIARSLAQHTGAQAPSSEAPSAEAPYAVP